MAEAAPGDTDGDGVIDSADELDRALADGTAVDTGAVRAFVCTVNRVPNG